MLVAAVVAAIVAPVAETDRSNRPRGINELLFFPSKYPDGNWNPEDLQYEDVFFLAEDNTRLHGWYCPSDDPRATILIAHGNAGHVASRASLLRHLQSKARVSVFIFDYRGYGRSHGSPTVEGALQDARAARAKLRVLASVRDSEMLLMGESLGGAIAIELAAESAPRSLILQSTFSSLKDVAEVHYPKYASFVPPTTLDSVTQIKEFEGPLFQSHGEHDRTIPFALGQKLFDAANEPKTFVAIPDAGHNNWLTDEYLQRLDAFIEHVSATP